MKDLEAENVCAENTFQELFIGLAKPLRNFLIYKGSESGQADDLVQESFIKLWENCKKVLPEKAKSYLYTLASNAFKNEMAHLKVRLEQAISELPETQREVFLMNRIDKLTYAEIAERLGVSVKAIEKRMGKALKHMRSKIKLFK